jgi:acyl transferase domain-containing protein
MNRNKNMATDKKIPQTTDATDEIAIIGMAGRFPGAQNLKDFWRNLLGGVESVSFFTGDELLAEGVSEAEFTRPRYVAAKGIVEGSRRFDASYFDLSTREATVMDPQFRVFLETVAEAMEDAAYTADNTNRRTGIFAGAASNTYQEHLRAYPELIEQVGSVQATILNEKDFLPTWAAYKLNLTGPCVTVQSACATSLVAVHFACQSLLNGECDIALAGGVSLSFPQKEGYQYVEGGLLSPDGHCRAFDAGAMGSVPGEGVGVVVLRRLDEAIEQGDAVRAIIKASSINNDGADKIGYLAPSEQGIATAVTESLAISGIDCQTIGYVEAHGTGTTLGDPIEIAALTKAFRAQTEEKEFCAIGSVKTNIGHLNTAAGIAGLIKTVLMLENGVIVPSLHYEEPNPLLKLTQTPFYVSTQAIEWTGNGHPRRAAVNTFGIGGTNAHVILEEAPFRKPCASFEEDELLVLSARSKQALRNLSENLATHLENSPNLPLSAAAYTLSAGRRAHEYRRTILCSKVSEAVKLLRTGTTEEAAFASKVVEDVEVMFQFRDKGVEHLGLIAELYRNEPVFQQEFDACATLSQVLVADPVYALIIGGSESAKERSANQQISPVTSVAVEYALAKLLFSWGVHPQTVTGHGIGEYTAACIAGILSLKDALSLAAEKTKNNREVGRISFPVASTTTKDNQQGERQKFPAFFSNVLGQWLTPDDTPALENWLHNLQNQQSSAQALQSSVYDQSQLLLEIGVPGPDEKDSPQHAIAILRHQKDELSDKGKLLTAMGRLWLGGGSVDWQAFYSNQQRQRISLPTYPFERQSFWAGGDDPNDNFSESNDEVLTIENSFSSEDRTYIEPENDLQAVVAAIWAVSLGIESVGIQDDFFTIGGNSLVATRIILAIRETLQIDLPLRALFDSPTVIKLCEEIEEAARQLDTDVHQIARVAREIAVLPMDQIKKRLAGA